MGNAAISKAMAFYGRGFQCVLIYPIFDHILIKSLGNDSCLILGSS